MVGCEEALEEVVQEVAEDYIDEKKAQAEDAIDDAVSGVLGELEEGYNQVIDGREQIHVTNPDCEVGADTVHCDHSTPAVYIEENTADTTEPSENINEELSVIPTEESTEQESEKQIFDVTIRITCKCGHKNIEDVAYETFVELVDPPYNFWSGLLGVSEYEYYTRKYAIYLGKSPIDLDIGLDAKEAIIHYDANGGFNPPEDQYFNPTAIFTAKICEEMPVRAGYHFLGWTNIAGSNTPIFFPNHQMKNDGDKITGETTLYACWEKHSYPTSTALILTEISHKFTVTQKRTTISIKCSCGMAVNNRRIDITEFLSYCFNKDTKYAYLSSNEKEKYLNMYKLYKAQDIGPVALYLNTSFYENATDPAEQFAELIGSVNDIADTIDNASEKANKLANRLLTTKADKQFAEEFFGGISSTAGAAKDAAEKATLAISIYQGAKSFVKMANPDTPPLDATMSFLDTLECIVSFTSVDSCVKPIFNVLRAGIELIEKCEKKRATYYTTLEETLNSTQHSEYLNYIFDNKDIYLALGELYLAGGTGGDHKNGLCSFETGNYLKSYPSVFEVMHKIASCPSHFIPHGDDAEFILLYLAERSRHELSALTGLTLDEYADIASQQFG